MSVGIRTLAYGDLEVVSRPNRVSSPLVFHMGDNVIGFEGAYSSFHIRLRLSTGSQKETRRCNPTTTEAGKPGERRREKKNKVEFVEYARSDWWIRDESM